jgi:chromosome segregation ATPase
MSKIEDLVERVDRLVLRHQELKRTSSLIEQQLGAVTAERDSLRSRLAAARARIDALLERLPADSPVVAASGPAVPPGEAPDKAPATPVEKSRRAAAG